MTFEVIGTFLKSIMNFITSPKSGRLKPDQPDWLLRLCGDMLLELDQEILEDWESPSDSLILIQAVWEEKNSLETRLYC